MANVIILSCSASIYGLSRYAGAYRVATSLREAGYSVQVIDFFETWAIDNLIKALKRYVDKDTYWIGFSSTFFPNRTSYEYVKVDQRPYPQSMESMNRLFKEIKDINSNVKFVYGGAYSHHFRDLRNIDFYLIGYSDTLAVKLTEFIRGKVDKLPFDKVKDSHALSLDWKTIPNDNAHNLPIIWHKEDKIFRKEALPIEISRGCIFNCKFCAFMLKNKRKGDYVKNADLIRDEMIRNYETFGTTNYFFTDDTHNDDPEKLAYLFSVYETLPFKLNFSSYLRLDLLNAHRHTIDILHASGLIGPLFGLETLNHENGKLIGKGMHPQKAIDFLWHLKDRWKTSVNLHGCFILGLPHDTKEYLKYFEEWILSKDNPLDGFNVQPLRIRYDPANRYLSSSDFDIRPRDYGYTPLADGSWVNKHTSFQEVGEAVRRVKELSFSKGKTKITGFSTMSVYNIGVSKNDMLNFSELAILAMYDISNLRSRFVRAYQNAILNS
jgi:hypothetical protein